MHKYEWGEWSFDTTTFSLWVDLKSWKVGFENDSISFSIQLLCFEVHYWKTGYNRELPF